MNAPFLSNVRRSPRGSRYYLVCYDIADPRRLQRVHRHVSQHTLALQYSVFLAHFNSTELCAFLAEVDSRIHPKFDDLRIYPVLPQTAISLGRQPSANGIFLPGIPLSSGFLSSNSSLNSQPSAAESATPSPADSHGSPPPLPGRAPFAP